MAYVIPASFDLQSAQWALRGVLGTEPEYPPWEMLRKEGGAAAWGGEYTLVVIKAKDVVEVVVVLVVVEVTVYGEDE